MARFEELLETLAGDDKVHLPLAPVRGVSAKRLRNRLADFLAKAMAQP